MATIGIIAVTILSIILEGFTFTTLWGWFVAGTFNVATLTIAQGIGLSMAIRFVTNENPTTEKMSFAETIVKSILRCLLTLLVGFIVLLFI